MRSAGGGFWLGLAGALVLALGSAGLVHAQAPVPAQKKVLNVAFRSAETNFDPSNIGDIYSRTITPHIFEALYQYDHLARPAKAKPLLAASMPEVSPDFRVWTIPVKAGIFFR